ncbi:transglutaminase domain-containing protein [Polaribacter sp. OB-PA-B3]
MKQFIYFFLLISYTTFSQNFDKVDKIVLEYPRFSKIENLALRIDTDFSKDEEKVRAAFFWLAKNIRYDLNQYYNPKGRSFKFSYRNEIEKEQKLEAAKNKIIDKTFKTKKGLCEEYAQSFKKVCSLLNIEAAVIKGYTRNSPDDIGRFVSETNHAWNAVKLNDKWIILDPTWAAGYLMNGKWTRKFNPYFYDIPKDKFFKTHLPEESIWVLRLGRITKKEFYNQPIYGQEFLASTIELISPKNGIIKIKKGENIVLKFKNLSEKASMLYNYKNHNYAKRPILKSENNITTLTILNPLRNSELFLFLNNRTALQFKVE